MAIKTGTNFEVQATLPIDVRAVVENTAALATLGNTYEGLLVWVKDINKFYIFTNTGTYEEFKTGGGGLICETAAATSAKVIEADGFSLTTGYLLVQINNANSYNGKITLNINSTGAKDIWINGAVSSSTNKTLNAGMYLAYYDGTQYKFRTDGKISGPISYNDLSDKPTIPSAPGTLQTNLTTAQATSASEALTGNIKLHQVAKTGNADKVGGLMLNDQAMAYTSELTTEIGVGAGCLAGTMTEAEIFALTGNRYGQYYLASDTNKVYRRHVVKTDASASNWRNDTVKYNASLSLTNQLQDEPYIYVKVNTNTPYYSKLVKFFIFAGYDNISGSTTITGYCRAQNKFYVNSCGYNGNNLLGIYQPTASTDVYYLKLKRYASTYGAASDYSITVKVMTNFNASSGYGLEFIGKNHASYATVSAYNYYAVPADGISTNDIKYINGASVPASGAAFTDANVKMTGTNTNTVYPILFKYTNSNGEETNQVRFDNDGITHFNYNPSTNTLKATNITTTTINGVTVGNSPKFTDTNTAHTHTNGIGLVRTGNGGINGTVDYKVNLVDETLNTGAASKSTSTSGGLYAVEADKNGDLAVRVPWTDTNTTYDLTTSADTTAGKLNLVAGGSGSGTDTITILGTGGATVSSDANGNITISSEQGQVPNDGVLTLKAGTNTKTFTANQADNTDFEVTAADLGISEAGTVGSTTQGIYLNNGEPTVMTYELNKTVPSDAIFTDTKNTAGSTDTASKIFLVGATSQAANPQTYSHDTVYVDTDGYLYSDSKKVLTDHQDISGKEDKSNKVTSWQPSPDDTHYPSEKLVKDSIDDVREIAAGKTKNYITNTTQMPALNTQNNDVTLTSFKDKDGNTVSISAFNIGDNIYITNTEVPDRWVGAKTSTSITVYKLETAKVPVTDVKVDTTSVISNTVATINTINSDYNATTNKLATANDLPDISGKADKSTTVTDVAYDATNKKLTKTINGTKSDIVTTATLKTDMGLATVATSGSYNDLSNKPNAVTITDQAVTSAGNIVTSLSVSNNTITAQKLPIATSLDAYNPTGKAKLPTSGAVANYIAARGENLLTNGTFLLNSNYNFNAFNRGTGGGFRTDDAYYCGGCVQMTGSISPTTNEYISVDPNQTYKLSYYIKCSDTNVTQYDLIEMSDIDYFSITANYVMFISGTTTYLTQDLKPGDTVVHVNNVSAWQASERGYRRGLIFWNYTNSKGYGYKIEGYSRYRYTQVGAWASTTLANETEFTVGKAISSCNHKDWFLRSGSGTSADPYVYTKATTYVAGTTYYYYNHLSGSEVGLWSVTDRSAFNDTNNTITLANPWQGRTFVSGTYLSQSSSGGTYKYLNAGYTVSPANTWVNKVGYLKGVGVNDASGKFRDGTAFVRLGFLINYSNQTGGDKDSAVTKLSNLTFALNIPTASSDIGAAPISHAVNATTYGVGTSDAYGHVKIITGDLNGKTHNGGYAASQAHTHSQYALQSSIPTVNNGKLSIQGNGTVATEFTANQSSDVALNIKGDGATTVTKSADNEITISSTDTTYESKTAVSGGTAVSLCTTGEKYEWNQVALEGVYYEEIIEGITIQLQDTRGDNSVTVYDGQNTSGINLGTYYYPVFATLTNFTITSGYVYVTTPGYFTNISDVTGGLTVVAGGANSDYVKFAVTGPGTANCKTHE